jgi:thymidine kinase
MNSGKSIDIIRTAHNYTERNKDVVKIKPAEDTKSEFIIARAGLKAEVDILAEPGMNLREEIGRFAARKALRDLQVVLVDESQFLEPQQIDQLYEVAKLDDTSVIAWGLRTDFQSNLFPGSKRLLELADIVEKIPTMCRCDKQAEFNTRKIGDRYVFDGAQVAIDEEHAETDDSQKVTYDSLCGTCYLEEKAKALAT